MVALLSTISFGQITGTAHDFSAKIWNAVEKGKCNVCHTPHNASTESNAPLWDHGVTTATFTLYTRVSSMQGVTAQPDGSSKLCLSCHDGTVALDSFGAVVSPSTNISGDQLIGTDLSNDHPISFEYTTALASSDGELWDPATVNSGLGSTIAADLLKGGQIQCSSCHDVHATGTTGKLLVITNEGSALCLTCHNK